MQNHFDRFDAHRDRHLWAFLRPCSPRVRQIDFLKLDSSYTVGRNVQCDIILTALFISNEHATFQWTECKDGTTLCHIIDNSRNGTFLNDKRLNQGIASLLNDGDVISFVPLKSTPARDEDFRYIYRDLAGTRKGKEGVIYNHYQDLKFLASGGFGAVYTGKHRKSGKLVAVKRISPYVAGGGDSHIESAVFRPSQPMGGSELSFALKKGQMLIQELMYMETVDHPNVIKVVEAFFEVYRYSYTAYIVMELMPRSLYDYIHERGSLGETLTRPIIWQLTHVIACLHAKGIIHRDIKPENVLLTLDEPPIVKLADFGLAGINNPARVGAELIIGTAAYAAPELLNGEGPRDPADCYALGALMFAAISGMQPFPTTETTDKEILRVEMDARSLPWEDCVVTTACRAIIERLVLPNPAERLTASEVLHCPWFLDFRPAPHIFIPKDYWSPAKVEARKKEPLIIDGNDFDMDSNFEGTETYSSDSDSEALPLNRQISSNAKLARLNSGRRTPPPEEKRGGEGALNLKNIAEEGGRSARKVAAVRVKARV